MPSRVAIAGSGNALVVTDRVPLTRPFAAGVKAIPIEQLAWGPKLEPHAFSIKLNGVETLTVNPDAV